MILGTLGEFLRFGGTPLDYIGKFSTSVGIHSEGLMTINM